MEEKNKGSKLSKITLVIGIITILVMMSYPLSEMSNSGNISIIEYGMLYSSELIEGIIEPLGMEIFTEFMCEILPAILMINQLVAFINQILGAIAIRKKEKRKDIAIVGIILSAITVIGTIMLFFAEIEILSRCA